jgi:pyruvate/2-oxoglutarate dehydrogenase complex dihydrolipoamide dehydrogenase (E3) component
VVEGLGLEAAGVVFDHSGIRVDDRMRTSAKHIYAVGDYNGSPQFTHYAGWQGAMEARNAILPGTDPGTVELVPRVTFTDPEVASVGFSEADARGLHDDVVVSERPMSRVDQAITEGSGDGVVKVVHRRDGTILGMTIVAPPAGEMIHEWIIAMKAGQKMGDMAQALHAYPTHSLGAQQLAAEVRISKALSGISGRLAKQLSKVVR